MKIAKDKIVIAKVIVAFQFWYLNEIKIISNIFIENPYTDMKHDNVLEFTLLRIFLFEAFHEDPKIIVKLSNELDDVFKKILEEKISAEDVLLIYVLAISDKVVNYIRLLIKKNDFNINEDSLQRLYNTIFFSFMNMEHTLWLEGLSEEYIELKKIYEKCKQIES